MAENAEITTVKLPTSLPYPIIVISVSAPVDSTIRRGDHLIEYKFTSATSSKALSRKAKGLPPIEGDEGAKEWDMIGTWDSEMEGDVVSWDSLIMPHARLERNHAGKQVLSVKEPCTHAMRFGGMCAMCGADLSTSDYLSRPEAEPRAGPSSKTFEMSHDAMGVTVSTNEAKRLENQTRDELLANRKLSLIVDLDQTIIHTTVDPTVGEWKAEIEEKEKQRATSNDDSTTPPGSPKTGEVNPNAEALRDVAKFEIADDLPPGYRKGKGKAMMGQERWYYTKPRPGLSKFLQDMSKLYEMHVYTMGTRSYADAICKIVDPDGTIFGTRILSRDESGSSSAKDLTRLFPTDHKMVVVIDDRADVWSNGPNLVKVVPYDFFLGSGDINSTFLPPNPNKPTLPIPLESGKTITSSPDGAIRPVEVSEAEGAIAQAKLLDQQSESRPLAKMQEELEEKETKTEEGGAEEAKVVVEGSDGTEVTMAETKDTGPPKDKEEKSTTPPGSPVRSRRKPLLNPFDDELKRVATILSQIHSTFYSAYETRLDRTSNDNLPLDCDVMSIVPEMKAAVLDSCRIVFSGVIPRHIKPSHSAEWQQAEIFGASVQADIMEPVPGSNVKQMATHCVVKVEGTEKANRAAELGIRVVWLAWFEQCVALWRRVNERDYLVARHQPKAKSIESRISIADGTPRADALQLQVEAEPNTSGAVNGNEMNNAESSRIGVTGSEDDDDERWMASIREEAGIDDDDSDIGTEDDTSRGVPSSPAGSVLDSPRSSRAQSVETADGGSQPGTPRKRVRYADEESLPLESFQDAPANALASPPRKRPRALLMPPQEGDVPPENVIQWKDSGKRSFDTENTSEDSGPADEADGTDGAEDEEDEFEKMLRESMGE